MAMQGSLYDCLGGSWHEVLSTSQTMTPCLFLILTKLQWQYRMHPGLSAAPSRIWYDDRLKDGVTATERELPAGAFPDPASPMKFVHVEGKEAILSRMWYAQDR